MSSNNLASLGRGVYIGDWHACDPVVFPDTIHIWRRGNIEERQMCRTMMEYGPHFRGGGLQVEWSEGHSIANMTPSFDTLMDHVRRVSGNLLIHCSAGRDRTAHMAVAVLAMRGVPPLEAIDRVYRGMWYEYRPRHVPGFKFELLEEILNRLGVM